MSYTLELDTTARIISANLTGPLTQQFRKEVLVALASKQHQCGFTNLLIDVSGTEFSLAEPMMNALDLVTFMTALDFLPETKLAFISVKAAPHRKFFADMAHSRGFNICYFNSRENAISWLSTEETNVS